MPTRMRSGLMNEPFRLDPLMAELASELKAVYLSPIQTLCDTDGCLVREEGKPFLFAWDDVHLTEAGSVYLARQWANGNTRKHAKAY